MACSGSSGYMGYLIVNGKVLPFLTADLFKIEEILASQSVHGGGSGQTNPLFRSQHNFARGRQTVEGSVQTEVYGGGGYGLAWIEMLKRVIPAQTDDSDVCTGFTTTSKLIYCPGGQSEIVVPTAFAANPKCMIASMDLRGNNGGVIQSTFRIIGTGADFNDTNANKPTSAQLQFESAGNTDDSNPVPYWASTFAPVGTGESGTLADRITDWNVTINNNPIPVYTFNGESFAQDVVLGQLQVTGSFSYYSNDGTFVETLTNGATLTIQFGTVTLHMPFLAFSKTPIPNSGPNQIVVRNCEFTAFAQVSGPSVYYSIS